jgi:hypothetical protein
MNANNKTKNKENIPENNTKYRNENNSKNKTDNNNPAVIAVKIILANPRFFNRARILPMLIELSTF